MKKWRSTLKRKTTVQLTSSLVNAWRSVQGLQSCCSGLLKYSCMIRNMMTQEEYASEAFFSWQKCSLGGADCVCMCVYLFVTHSLLPSFPSYPLPLSLFCPSLLPLAVVPSCWKIAGMLTQSTSKACALCDRAIRRRPWTTSNRPYSLTLITRHHGTLSGCVCACANCIITQP